MLAFLAVEGRQTRDDVSALLWGAGRLRNLRQELHVLRQLPGAGEWLVTEPGHVEVRAETDVAMLRHAVGTGQDPSRWWRGTPGSGLEQVRAPAFVEWLEHLRGELEQVRVQAAVSAARRALGQEDDDGAWGIVWPLLEEAPYDELVWRVAIEVRLQQGRTAEGLTLLEAAERRFELEGRDAWAPIVDQLRRRMPSRQGLPMKVRQVLQALCISEEPLPVSVLGAVVEQPDLALAESLQHLRDGGWLNPEGHVAREVREEVQDALVPQAAQVLHGRLADALTSADEAPGRIAVHLEAAGRPSSAAYLDQARRSGSLGDLEHALRTARTPTEQCEGLAEAVRLATRQGQPAQAHAWWQRLEDVAVRSQDAEGLRQTAVLGALLEARSGALTRAHARLDDAVVLVGEHDPAIAVVRGALAFFAGRPEDARALLFSGLATDDIDLRLTAVNMLGAVAGLAGDVETADQLHREALTLARRERRFYLVMMLLNNLAATAQRRGDLAAAIERYDEAARLAETLGELPMQAFVAFNEAHARIELGRLGAARSSIRRLLGVSTREPRIRGLGCRARADLERTCGRFEEAAAWSARAIAAFEDSGDVAHHLASRFNEAQARFLADESHVALRDMRRTLEQIEALDRHDLVSAGRAELALCSPDAGEVRTLAASTPQTPREWAVVQRLALLEEAGLYPGVEAQLGTGQAFVGNYLDALAATAMEETEPKRADQLRHGLKDRIDVGAQGLLTAQRGALHRRVRQWIEEPGKHW
ncbi:MAG: hypothetical protein AAGA48_32665 [Myxococcota bacterium]